MILPKVRDKRFVTIRRGGILTDSDHHLLALWAAECAEHVLHFSEVSLCETGAENDAKARRFLNAPPLFARFLYESVCPNDERPRMSWSRL